MTARLNTDFSLSLAEVALVLGVATAEEHAVVVERETVGSVESEILTTFPIRAHLPTGRKIRVADLDDVKNIGVINNCGRLIAVSWRCGWWLG